MHVKYIFLCTTYLSYYIHSIISPDSLLCLLITSTTTSITTATTTTMAIPPAMAPMLVPFCADAEPEKIMLLYMPIVKHISYQITKDKNLTLTSGLTFIPGLGCLVCM